MGLEDDVRARRVVRASASPEELVDIRRREAEAMVREISENPHFPEVNNPRFFEYRDLLAREWPDLRAEPVYRVGRGPSVISKFAKIGEGWVVRGNTPGCSYEHDDGFVMLTTGWLGSFVRRDSKIVLTNEPTAMSPAYNHVLLDLADELF